MIEVVDFPEFLSFDIEGYGNEEVQYWIIVLANRNKTYLQIRTSSTGKTQRN